MQNFKVKMGAAIFSILVLMAFTVPAMADYVNPPTLDDENTMVTIPGFDVDDDDALMLIYSNGWVLQTEFGEASGSMLDAGAVADTNFDPPNTELDGEYFLIVGDDTSAATTPPDFFQLIPGRLDADDAGGDVVDGAVPDIIEDYVFGADAATAWIATNSKLTDAIDNDIELTSAAGFDVDPDPNNPFLCETDDVLAGGDTAGGIISYDLNADGAENDNGTVNTAVAISAIAGLDEPDTADAVVTLFKIAGGTASFAVALDPSEDNLVNAIDVTAMELNINAPAGAPAAWSTDFNSEPGFDEIGGSFTAGDFIDVFTFVLEADETTLALAIGDNDYDITILPSAKLRITDTDGNTFDCTWTIGFDDAALTNIDGEVNDNDTVAITDGIGPYVKLTAAGLPGMWTANADGDTFVDGIYVAFDTALNSAVATSLTTADFVVFVDANNNGTIDDGEIIANAVTSVELTDMNDYNGDGEPDSNWYTDENGDNTIAEDCGLKLNLDDTLIDTGDAPKVRLSVTSPLTDIKDANGAKYGMFYGTLYGTGDVPVQLVNHFTFDDNETDPHGADYADDDAKDQLGLEERRLSVLFAPQAADLAAPGIESATYDSDAGTVTVEFNEDLVDEDLSGYTAQQVFVIRNIAGTKLSFDGEFDAVTGMVDDTIVFTLNAISEPLVDGFTIQAYTYPMNNKVIADTLDNYVSESNAVAFETVSTYAAPTVDCNKGAAVSLIENPATLFFDTAELTFGSDPDTAIALTTLALVKNSEDGGDADTVVTDAAEIADALVEMFLVYDGGAGTWNKAATAVTMTADSCMLTLEKPSSISSHVLFAYQEYVDDSGDFDVTYQIANADGPFDAIAAPGVFCAPTAGNWTAETVDSNFDGIVDAIDMTVPGELGEAEDGTIDTEDFSVSLIADGSAVPIADEAAISYDEDADETTVRLVLDPDGDVTDWYPNDDDKAKLFTDAANFLNIFYSGNTFTLESGANMPEFLINEQADACAPVPVAENVDGVVTEYANDGASITVAWSEDVVVPAGLNDDQAAYYLVFLDAEGNVVDTSDWLFQTVAGAANTTVIDNVDDADTIATELYLSQGNGPEDLVDAIPNELDLQYNNLLMTGTKVPIAQADFPEIIDAYTFMQDGYYKYIWVTFSKPVVQSDATLTGAASLANAFDIVLNFNEVDHATVYQTLKAQAVSGSGTDWLLEVPHVFDEGTDADDGVRPISITYTDRSDDDGDYLADADGNKLAEDATETEVVDWYGLDDEQKVADVNSVEIWGALENFEFTGAEVIAYEAYQQVSTEKGYKLTVSFDYGPLSQRTKGAFGIQANGATDQCHQNGSYITLVYSDGCYDSNGEYSSENYDDIDPLTAGDQYIADLVKAGYAYLHTDIDSNSQDADEGYSGEAPADVEEDVNSGFVFGLSLDPTPQGEHDSVFYVTFSTNANNRTIGVRGDYGITGSGSWTEHVYTAWHLVEEGGHPEVVGKDIIPFDHTDKDYKVVARDALAERLTEIAECADCVTEKQWASTILARRVLLVLKAVVPGTGTYYTLLNGVTDDVDIEYYFWNKDGSFNVDFDANLIFDYYVSGADGYDMVPLVNDKTYFRGKSAPAINTKYPGVDVARKNVKIQVTDVKDVFIGLDSHGYPMFMGDNSCTDNEFIFGLDHNGVAYGKSTSVGYVTGGHAYAINPDAAYTIYTFGYMMPDETQGVGGPLSYNVMNIQDPNNTRTKYNVGWNLLTNVEEIDLDGIKYVDYVIQFDSSEFTSWIENGTLNDFEELDNADDDGKIYGTGYFIHTSKDE